MDGTFHGNKGVDNRLLTLHTKSTCPFNSKFIFIYLFIHLFVSDILLLVAYKYCYVATGERCSQSPLRAATCTCNFKTAKNPATSKQSLLHESFLSHVLTTFTIEWFAHMREGL